MVVRVGVDGCRLCKEVAADEPLSPHTGLCLKCTKANCRHLLAVTDGTRIECSTCHLVLSDEITPLTQRVLNHAARTAKQMIPLLCGVGAMLTYPIMLVYQLVSFAESSAIASRDEAILDVYRKKAPEDEGHALAASANRLS